MTPDAFITKDNINDFLAESGFDEDLGILSIDIDGNDYFILEAINAVFGATRKKYLFLTMRIFREPESTIPIYISAPRSLRQPQRLWRRGSWKRFESLRLGG